jgi:indoleamine 2,3-dioxygenase
MQISNYLGIKPIITYAATELLNYHLDYPEDYELDNLRMTHLFTGTRDEEWFLAISIAIEAQGGKILTLILDILNAMEKQDTDLLTQHLKKFKKQLQKVKEILQRMTEEVFCNDIE